ncbi:probable DNA repair exonuclease [alpha proteobacterium U9-1i]|nr:probable DNA repair exonuclease [alpha proteobacterium U9-1i]
MQLVHLTDLHFGCEDKSALNAARKYIEENKPEAVIITGDISREGEKDELEAACAWMRELPAPVMVTPGNHDVPYYNLIGRVLDPWSAYEKAARGLRTDAWCTPDWTIVPINTARALQLRLNWAQGAISDVQVATAAAELRKCQPDALRIVITHHPLDWPNDAPIKGATINGVPAQGALIEAGAQLFLSGHLHFASARLIGTQALSITSGTLSQRVRHEPCAFTVIRRPSPNVIETEVMHVVQGVAQTASKRQFTLQPTPIGQPDIIRAKV